MMKYKKLIISIVLLISLLAVPVTAIASDISGAVYWAQILISNNSTATTNVATVITGTNTTNLINGGYLNASANNTVIRTSSGADVPFMPGYTPGGYPWCVWVPSIGANTYNTDILYTADSSGGEIRYFPDPAIGMTTLDSAALETGDNFTYEMKGWVDTSTAGNIIAKDKAMHLITDGSGNVTAHLFTDNNTIPNDFSDPGASWTDEANAYDNNVGTYATATPIDGQDYIILKQTGGRRWVVGGMIWQNDAGATGADSAYIDVYDYDTSSWIPTSVQGVGAYPPDEWIYGYTSVPYFTDQMRVKLTDGHNVYLKEGHFIKGKVLSASGVTSGEHTVELNNTPDNSLDFDGSGEFDVGNEAEFQFEHDEAFALFVWGKTTADGTRRELVQKSKITTNYNGVWFFKEPVEKLTVQLYDGVTPGSQINKTTAGTISTDGLWHLWTLVYDGGSYHTGIRLYEDGIPLATTSTNTYTLVGTLINTNPLKIGSGTAGASWNGGIGESYVYRGVNLTDAQVLQIYNTGEPISTGLVGWWRVDEGTGATVTDYSGNGNDGTITGATWNATALKRISLWVDSTREDTAVSESGDYTITDNGNNLISFIDSVPYAEYQKLTIDGTLEQSIYWEYSDNFTDLSGNGHWADPSFRTTSSDADVSANMTSFMPVSESQAPAYVLATAPDFIDAAAMTGNITAPFTIVPPAGTFPLAGVIAAVAAASSTPAQLPLVLIAGFIIIAASLTASSILRKHGSGTLIIKIIAITAVAGIFVTLGNFGIDLWMLSVFLIIAIAIAMGSRHQSWS